MRRLSVPLLLAALVTLALAAPTAAARPEHEIFKIDETFPEELCGIEVTTTVQGNGNVLIFPDGPFVDLSTLLITWTNDDGDWLTLFFAGPASFTESLDGDILTVTSVHRGLHELLRSSEGITAAFDRGRIIFHEVIDLNDLEDFEDDVVLSFEVLFHAGPHPEADANFELFCEVVTDVLG